jgi:hypothetical protein
MTEERQMTESDSTTAQAADKAQEMAGQAKEQAQQTASQAKDQLRSQVDQRSTMAGEQVSRQAGDIRTVAEQLREQGKEGPAKVAEQAAERAERVGSYLQQSDADRILSDVEDFARSNPWAVAAGGLAFGFAASRMLKASSSRRYEERTRVDRQLPAVGETTSVPGVTDALAPEAPPRPAAVDDPLGRPAPPPVSEPPAVSDPLRTPTPGSSQ